MKQLYYRPILVNDPLEYELSRRIVESLGEAHLPLADALILLLNGSHSWEEIFGKLLMEGFELQAILTMLQWLDDQGLIQEAPNVTTLSDAEKEFYKLQMVAFDHFVNKQGTGTVISGIRANIEAQFRLKKAVAVIIGLGLAGSDLVRSLALAGVGYIIAVHDSTGDLATMNQSDETRKTKFQDEIQCLNSFIRFVQIDRIEDLSTTLDDLIPNLLIYCPDRFSDEICELFNKVCLDYSVPFLIYQHTLLEINMGPLIIPHETACYVCYDRRRKAVLSEVDIERSMGFMNSFSSRLNFSLATDLLALEIVKFLTGVLEPVTRGCVWQLNTLSGLLELHPVLKLPRCPACGVHKIKPLHKLWEE
jgi:molybdopterin-synthase adenylyltransferase